MNFTSKFEATNVQNLYLIKGDQDSEPCWHYLLLGKLKAPIFLELSKCFPMQVNLAEYGKVVASGWGEEPPKKVVDQVKSGNISNFENSSEVIEVQTKDGEGNDFFAYILMPSFLVDELQANLASGQNNNLYNYGTILKWGWGHPTQVDLAEIEEVKKQFAKSIIDA